MKIKLFLIFLFLFFVSNAVFAEVSITESDAELFWEQGYSYEDINNTVEHYRSLGLKDEEIQKKLDKRIKEFKTRKIENIEKKNFDIKK